MTQADPKIIDLIKAKEENSKPFSSIEFFPPRTEVGVKVSNERGRYPMTKKKETTTSVLFLAFCVVFC